MNCRMRRYEMVIVTLILQCTLSQRRMIEVAVHAPNVTKKQATLRRNMPCAFASGLSWMPVQAVWVFRGYH